ncbi:MAG TPA: SAP domain-containing protein [Phycisphaerae bacterium]|nr:SAP domain-containing protein [Phycisphaerae bacterium]
MKMAEVRSHAKQMGIKSVRKTKETLIREIQRAESNRDCYNRGERDTCAQEACAWRAECR